jgi:hypothetical protein
MNTKLNIETLRRSFSRNVVTLLVLVVALLALGGSSVQAQTATADTTATTDSTASKQPVVSTTAPGESSMTLPAKGTVSDPSGAINFNGNVNVFAKRVIDTTSATTPTVVVLDLDFSALTGTSGSKTTLKTYVTGGNHAGEIRPLQATDTIILSCPYFDNASGPLTARTMLVTATLNFDVNSGTLTGGSISIGNNTATSATVGTFAPM